jgi:MFS family permease
VLSIVALCFLRERPGLQRDGAKTPTPATGRESPAGRPTAQALGPRFWLFTAVATLFALANASDAFIFLRTAGLEYAFSPLEAVPLLYCGYNIVYALLSTPLGALSDRWGRLPVLLLGYGTFAAVYVGWAFANHGWHVWLLFLCYGVYAAATEGVGKALVTDLVPRAQRGAALGWFGGLTGAAALPANVLAGWLWATFRPSTTFAVDAGIAAVATVVLLGCAPRLRRETAIPASA